MAVAVVAVYRWRSVAVLVLTIGRTTHTSLPKSRGTERLDDFV